MKMLRELQDLLVSILTLGVVLCPIGILGWQAYGFLQTGVWEPFSALDLLKALGLFEEWIAYPQEWIGVYKILDWLHGSVLVVAAILLVAAPIAGMLEEGT